MKNITVLAALLCGLTAGAWALSIHDVQFATSAGVDNSYPSSYLGRDVTLEGVVTATGYRNGGYFISEPVSGAWRGILIYDKRNNPSPGDLVRVSGSVAELFGMTCVQDLSAYRLLDRKRPLPMPVIVSTGQISNPLEAEAYEGVYVKLLNSTSNGSKAKSGKFMINDGSGQCSVLTGSFSDKRSLSPAVGVQFSSLTGVVAFGYGEFSLNPVSTSDIGIQQPVSTQNRSWGKIKSIYK
jgi:hypothetical protein